MSVNGALSRPLWPTALPDSLRRRAADSVLRIALGRVPVGVHFPDGSRLGLGGQDAPQLEIVRPNELLGRLSRQPKIGVGDGYVAGDWRAAAGTDLADALTPFARHLAEIIPARLLRWRRVVDSALPQHHRGTPEGARANVAAHYDLSNSLFAAFLDGSMTYSSALFDTSAPLPEQDLQRAQWRKIDRALDAAGVRAGTRVLEIGTGWGELAIRAATRGAEVVSITLSAEQQALAQQRIAEADMDSRVQVRLADYRSVAGSYDAVLSIEMIEAVGEEFWPDYFAAIDRVLAPGGTAVIQAILMDHTRFLATRHSHGWIQERIFPGGLIPSLPALDQACAGTRLARHETFLFGTHYAETLRRWRHRFLTAWPSIAGLGFDGDFQRMWEFYLAYCEAGFAARYLEVAQIQYRRS